MLESSEHINTSNYNQWEKSHIFFIPVLENSEQVNVCNIKKAGD